MAGYQGDENRIWNDREEAILEIKSEVKSAACRVHARAKDIIAARHGDAQAVHIRELRLAVALA